MFNYGSLYDGSITAHMQRAIYHMECGRHQYAKGSLAKARKWARRKAEMEAAVYRYRFPELDRRFDEAWVAFVAENGLAGLLD